MCITVGISILSLLECGAWVDGLIESWQCYRRDAARGKKNAPFLTPHVGINATHTLRQAQVDRDDRALLVVTPERERAMTLGERLKLVRGASSQKAFAAELSLHENTVSNAERRNSATLEYLLRLTAVRNINLHWLITGQGSMRAGDADGSLLQEKIHLALADALRAAYGGRYAAVPLETRARALRAGTSYLRAIGVTAESLPDADALAKLLRLTIDVMRGAA